MRPRGGDSKLFDCPSGCCSFILHFSCNSFLNTSLTLLIVVQPVIRRNFSQSTHYRLFQMHCWLFPKRVYLCFNLPFGILKHTLSVWEGNWSTTAENRGIRCESSGMCRCKCGLFSSHRQCWDFTKATYQFILSR